MKKEKQLELDLDNWEEFLEKRGRQNIRRVYKGGVKEIRSWYMNHKDVKRFIKELLKSVKNENEQSKGW